LINAINPPVKAPAENEPEGRDRDHSEAGAVDNDAADHFRLGDDDADPEDGQIDSGASPKGHVVQVRKVSENIVLMEGWLAASTARNKAALNQKAARQLHDAAREKAKAKATTAGKKKSTAPCSPPSSPPAQDTVIADASAESLRKAAVQFATTPCKRCAGVGNGLQFTHSNARSAKCPFGQRFKNKNKKGLKEFGSKLPSEEAITTHAASRATKPKKKKKQGKSRVANRR
jgi:hypothetical protein